MNSSGGNNRGGGAMLMGFSSNNNNNNSNTYSYSGSSSSNRSPFTVSQRQELKHQALIFKYMVAGLPVPPDLVLPIRKSFDSIPHNFFHHPSSSYCSFYGKKVDPEPGQCRRTDGKKWRCDSKYCERHMLRDRNHSRKPVESQTVAQSSSTVKSLTVTAGSTRAGNFQNLPANAFGTRCRRVDGKKWRCSKEAYPDSKYCERHLHRDRNRSRKPVESQTVAQSSSTVASLTVTAGSTRAGNFQNLPANAFGSLQGTSSGTNRSGYHLDTIPYGIPSREYRYLQ